MRKLLLLLVVIASFSACKKNQESPNDVTSDGPSHFPMEIGNFWVYKTFKIDTLGNETELNKIDSLVINRDTIINGNKYFIIEGIDEFLADNQWRIFSILRDSSGNLVNPNGIIFCSENNFTDTLYSKVEYYGANDTLFTLTYKMENVANPISVPAGVFDAINFRGTANVNPNYTSVPNPRYINNYYAENVGAILKSFFYSKSPDIFERRLVNYNVN